MKKLYSAMLIIVMALTMVACGAKDNGDTKETTAAETNTETTQAASETTQASTEAKGKLIVGTEAGFAPYEYMEGNEVVGIDMDIGNGNGT
ncbi:MAG: hypothetical protein K0S18_709 [Anaerocolumna sp.]|nr:hypothetical protein [Anaerocolumna sp.]